MRLELTDPTHGTSEPGRLWTQTNINEATPEVLSPLCWTFWIYRGDWASKKTWYDFGLIPKKGLRLTEDPNELLISAFYGRQAINVDLVREIIALSPGGSPDQYEREVLGHVRDEAPAVEESRRRYPFVAVRLPKAIAVQGRRLRKVHDDQVAWWRRDVFPGNISDPRGLLAESQQRFTTAMCIHLYSRSNLLPSSQAQLSALASRVGGQDLVMKLLGGFGTTTETEIADDVWKVSRGRLDRTEFLLRHGFHGPSEGNPIARSWRENPAAVDALVKAYAERPDEDAPALRERDAATRHQAAVAELLAGVPASKRPVAKMLVKQVATQVGRLSVGKAAFVMAIDGARAATRALGADLVAQGVASDPDDCFYLTYQELLGPVPENFAEVVAFRRAKRAEYQKLRLPTTWTGMPEPSQLSDGADGAAGGVATEVTGAGGSPGVAEGRVRVIDDPADDEMLEPGEVLVCRFTDPSWSAIFTLAEAVVIDLGGLASHGAVVSREMGLPCVIGTGDGSRVLRTGDLVRVDGTAGTVTILERAADQ